ncbi:MAG: phosphohydrolase, partial [Gemmatimonadales bacterium]
MEEIVTPEEEGIPDSGPRNPGERFRQRVTMRVPDRHNPRLRQALEWVNENDDLYGLWVASNVTAIERLGMTDHGPVHVKIVMNLAVRLLRLLTEAGVEPSVTTHYDLPVEDAEVVVALAALFHDLGMSIHRKDHESYSLFLAKGLLEELLPQLWEDAPTRALHRSEIIHS